MITILQCVHIKRNVFTLYQEEYFLYTMSLWVCYRNFKAVVQRYSWIDDIEDKREQEPIKWSLHLH